MFTGEAHIDAHEHAVGNRRELIDSANCGWPTPSGVLTTSELRALRRPRPGNAAGAPHSAGCIRWAECPDVAEVV